MQNGLDNFAPHEILEMLLFFCIPQKNVNPLSHELIAAFGSLHGVLEATPTQLKQIKGIGENAAVLLSMIPAVFRRYQSSLSAEKPIIKNRKDAQTYCRSLFIGLKTEHFYLITLDSLMRVTGKPLIATGSLTEVPAYPRVVLEAALSHNAHSVILCHNHPSGTLAPSENDLLQTERLSQVFQSMEISLLDHFIVTPDGILSLKEDPVA
jgi:DNA repair protein RadC